MQIRETVYDATGGVEDGFRPNFKKHIQKKVLFAVLELHRIDDAVASRNIHAAVLDARRLCHVM